MTFEWPSWVDPMPFPFPELHNCNTGGPALLKCLLVRKWSSLVVWIGMSDVELPGLTSMEHGRCMATWTMDDSIMHVDCSRGQMVLRYASTKAWIGTKCEWNFVFDDRIWWKYLPTAHAQSEGFSKNVLNIIFYIIDNLFGCESSPISHNVRLCVSPSVH